MQDQAISIVVVGADSASSEAWLRRRLPVTPHAGAWVLRYPGAELDAVVFAEQLRLDARRAHVRLTLGVASGGADPTGEAMRAYARARALGGDLTGSTRPGRSIPSPIATSASHSSARSTRSRAIVIRQRSRVSRTRIARAVSRARRR